GAYQDIMGDLHNLFGRVTEVHVFLDPDEESGWYIEEVIEGSTIGEVLAMTQWDKVELMRLLKAQVDAAIKTDRLKPNDAMKLLSPTSLKDALRSNAPIDAIRVQGWVRTRRDSKDFSFIELNDGSSLRNLQIIARNTLSNYADVQRLTTGASIAVSGALVASQGKGQKWELIADNIEVIGTAEDSYPLQKKGHTPEFLREIAHLRPRSNLFSSVLRVR